MDHSAKYLEKYQKKTSLFGPPVQFAPDIIIVIPAYKENHILKTLESLRSCIHNNINIEVLIFINGKEIDDADTYELNLKCEADVKYFISIKEEKWMTIRYHSNLLLDKKNSGVGKARKLLMDDALYRFKKLYNKEGIIVNLDADSLVKSNYLNAIFEYFKAEESKDAVSIHFEHLLEEHKEAIIDYELHLRYFIGMQKLINLPFAFQTIGSSMAVKSNAYAKMGGMPQRSAGEDFYFLHKFSKIWTLDNLSSTTVYPSSRISDRVPFGTGRAILDYIENAERQTYDYQSFIILGDFLKQIPDWYINEEINFEGAVELKGFFKKINFRDRINEIRKHTSNIESFIKRFYQYFDAFLLMKYLHWMRDFVHQDIPISDAIAYYAHEVGISYLDKEDFLIKIRNFDKSNARQV